MPITDLLERNSKLYGDEIALVEINPEVHEAQRVTWKEYALIQTTSSAPYRREVTLFDHGREVTKEIEFFGWEKLDEVENLRREFGIL